MEISKSYSVAPRLATVVLFLVVGIFLLCLEAQRENSHKDHHWNLKVSNSTIQSRRRLNTNKYFFPNNFVVKVTNNNFQVLRKNHHHKNHTKVWTGIAGSFVKASVEPTIICEERGSFAIRTLTIRETESTTITSHWFDNNNNRLFITGELRRYGCVLGMFDCKQQYQVGYQLILFVPDDDDGDYQMKNSQLSFDLRLTRSGPIQRTYNRVFLQGKSDADEAFVGFGEQYTKVNMKRKDVTIITQENGIGRDVKKGDAGIVNFLGSIIGVNGGFDSSYAPAPYFITNHRRGLFLENYEISKFDMRATDQVAVKLFGINMRGRFLSGEAPQDMVMSYTQFTGRMQPLPSWMNKGAIVGMQGGTERVLQVLDQLNALETPMGAFWLQDWVGKRQTCFGSQLWWSWVLDRNQYPNWEQMVSRLDQQGIRVMTYTSPFLTPRPGCNQEAGECLYEFAESQGYLVLNQQGMPYQIGNTDFEAGLLDLTNPAAREWMKGIIRDNIIAVGASGWMADFGEALPVNSVLSSGQSAKVYHNQYPEEWARLNQEAVEEAGRTGDIVYFTRSGYTRSPGFTTLFWEGDQLVTWDENDGLKSAITGLLSGGISGFSLNHNDIGGYTTLKVEALTINILDITRSEELFLRWTEMNAFTAVFRTHEGIQPENNVQFYTNTITLSHFSYFAKVYAALAGYREVLMEEAATKGIPLVRHPLLQYPDDPVAWKLEYQWMLGPDCMVAPVTNEGQMEVNVYLPGDGTYWTHIWTDQVFPGNAWHRIAAPFRQPPVFFKTESPFYELFLQELGSAIVPGH